MYKEDNWKKEGKKERNVASRGGTGILIEKVERRDKFAFRDSLTSARGSFLGVSRGEERKLTSVSFHHMCSR